MGNNLLEIELGTSFIPRQITAGNIHNCALSTSNKVKCFGRNWHGQLGYGNTNDTGNAPNEMGNNLLEIELGTSFIPRQITAGNIHNCALSTSNKVKCFGRNWHGQLGYGDTNDRGDVPNEMGNNLLELDLGSSFIPMQITTGFDHTCVLSTNNKVKCFGWNHHGQLGYGHTENVGDEPNEMGDNLLEIDLGSTFIRKHIIARYWHTCWAMGIQMTEE
eukprot:251658_1